MNAVRIDARNLWRLCIVTAAVGGIMACKTSVGPIGDPIEFETALRSSIDHQDEQILHYGRARWVHGTDHVIFGDAKAKHDGILVTLPTRIVFVVWTGDSSSGRYENLIELQYTEFNDLTNQVYGLANWLVVRTDDDIHSFWFEVMGRTLTAKRIIHGRLDALGVTIASPVSLE